MELGWKPVSVWCRDYVCPVSHTVYWGVLPLVWLTSFCGLLFFFNQNATLIPNFLCQVTNNFSSLQSHFYLLSALLKSHSISMVFHSLSNLWISYSHEAICHIFSFLMFLFKSKPSSAFINLINLLFVENAHTIRALVSKLPSLHRPSALM